MRSIAIDDIIDCTLIALLKYSHMEDIAPDGELLRHLRHEVGTILTEDNDIIDIGAVADILIPLERRPDKTIETIYIELLIRLDNPRRLDILEALNLRPTLPTCTIHPLNPAVIVNSKGYDIGDVISDCSHLLLHSLNIVLRLIGGELNDTLHLYLKELANIIIRHTPLENRQKWFQALPDMGNYTLDRFPLLILFILIDTLLDKYPLKGRKVPLLHKLPELYLQLPLQKLHRIISRTAQNIGDSYKTGLSIVYDTGVGTYREFTIGKGVECIYRLIGGDTWGERQNNLNRRRSVIIDMLNLYLPLIIRLLDTLNERLCSRPIGDLRNPKALGINLLNSRPHSDTTSASTVTITAHIHKRPRQKIGIELKGLIPKIGDRGIYQLIEVVG